MAEAKSAAAASKPTPAQIDEAREAIGQLVAAPRSAEPLYEVVTDTWGAQPPIYRKGNTFVPSMLPPDRDVEWAERQVIVSKLPPEDPRQLLPPTGPAGDQTGVPSDGWITPTNPEFVPPQMVPQIVQAMRAAGASPAMIQAVQAQAATNATPIPDVAGPGEPASAAAIAP